MTSGNETTCTVTAYKKALQLISILVTPESGEASQWSWFPFQSVMTPPAPSMTGISERKSYGWDKIIMLIRWGHNSTMFRIIWLTKQQDTFSHYVIHSRLSQGHHKSEWKNPGVNIKENKIEVVSPITITKWSENSLQPIGQKPRQEYLFERCYSCHVHQLPLFEYLGIFICPWREQRYNHCQICW